MEKFRYFQTLPQDAVLIRTKVFMEEQGFLDEFDDIDPWASHIVLYRQGGPAATCRYFWDRENRSYVAGRIAVLPQYRGQGLGAAVLEEAQRRIQALGGDKVMLAAQVRAKGFYEKLGYAPVGAVFLEESCPHVWMWKALSPGAAPPSPVLPAGATPLE